MLSNDRKKIILMNPVRINTALSKYEKHKSTLGGSNSESSPRAVGFSDLDSLTSAESNMIDMVVWDVNNRNMWDGVPFEVQRRFRGAGMRAVFELYIRFRLLFNKPTKDPVDIFAEVKDNFDILKDHPEGMDEIVALLKQLERAKQTAAIKTAKEKQQVLTYEAILFEAGIKQYQTEDSLIGFIKQCKKGLCLTELETFERVIPVDIIDKINAAEVLKVFDNYYILHYDPSGAKNIYYTEEDRDPIIFGVIRGSEKLYYIGDWMDEYCNLTYKDLLKKGTDFKLTKPAKK